MPLPTEAAEGAMSMRPAKTVLGQKAAPAEGGACCGEHHRNRIFVVYKV